VQRGPAGEVERQAEAEADPGLDLAHALEDLLAGEEIDAAELVVVTPVAPRRSGRTLLPSRHALHCTDRYAYARDRGSRTARTSFPESGGHHMTNKDFIVSGDGHLLEPT